MTTGAPELAAAGPSVRRAVPAVARPRVGPQGLLMHRHLAGCCVVARRGEVPVALVQRLADRDRLHGAVGQAEAERDRARIVDHQREAGAAAGVPLGDDALLALARRGRPDHRLHGEALEPLQQRPALDDRVGAGVDDLPPPLVALAHGRANHTLLEAGAGGRIVGADELHDVRPVARMLAVDHEGDGLARPDADAVGIARDRQHAALPRRPALPAASIVSAPQANNRGAGPLAHRATPGWVVHNRRAVGVDTPRHGGATGSGRWRR